MLPRLWEDSTFDRHPVVLVSQKDYGSFHHSAMVFKLKVLTYKSFADTSQAVQRYLNQTINILIVVTAYYYGKLTYVCTHL